MNSFSTDLAPKVRRDIILVTMLLLCIICDMVDVYFNTVIKNFSIDVQNGIPVTLAIQTFAMNQQLFSRIQLATNIATAFFWLYWISGAYNNLSNIGSKRTNFTRKWAVGWWLIPVMNVWKAYEVTSDLVQRSVSKNELTYVNTKNAPPLVKIHWWLYIAMNTISWISFQVFNDSFRLEDVIVYANVATIVSLMGIIVSSLAIAIISSVETSQRSCSNDESGALQAQTT